jgi:hypothetical protein
MKMGIEIEEIAVGVYGDTGPGVCVFIQGGGFKAFADNIPPAPAQFGKKFPVVQKIDAESFGNAENPLPVRNIFQDFTEKPLTVFNHPLLMTGWAKVPSFA